MSDSKSSIVKTPEELGRKARKMRKSQKVSINNAAPILNLGTRFISEVERGKDTAELGKVLKMLDGIGLAVMVLPKATAQQLDRQLMSDSKSKK